MWKQISLSPSTQPLSNFSSLSLTSKLTNKHCLLKNTCHNQICTWFVLTAICVALPICSTATPTPTRIFTPRNVNTDINRYGEETAAVLHTEWNSTLPAEQSTLKTSLSSTYNAFYISTKNSFHEIDVEHPNKTVVMEKTKEKQNRTKDVRDYMNTKVSKNSNTTAGLGNSDSEGNHSEIRSPTPKFTETENNFLKSIKDYGTKSTTGTQIASNDKRTRMATTDLPKTTSIQYLEDMMNKINVMKTKQISKRTKYKGRQKDGMNKEFSAKTSERLVNFDQLSDDKGRSGRETRGKISLLGLFELSTQFGARPEGHSELAAALLAVRHINTRGLLPGYSLELLTNDTKCDPGVGVDRFFHALYTQRSTRMVMLLGSACSEVTESLAKVVPYWNIVQVSFGSTSPALSDRREFPLFYRTVAPDSSHNPARIAFIRRFGWDTVTALSQNEEVYSLAVNDLVTELERANITCAATITFAETDFKDQLRMVRDLDTRIIIGSFSHKVAPKIFCEAYQLGMFGADYAWILQGPPDPHWWNNSTECPQNHLAAAVERLIIVSSHNSIVGGMPSYSGLTNSMFISELESLSMPVTRYAPQTYDAVWAIALALRGAEDRWTSAPMDGKPRRLGWFDYTRKDMAKEFLVQLGQLNFLGVSGPVSFSGADRIGTSAFYQIQGGEVRGVALYYPEAGELDFQCPECEPVRWESGQVPIARRVFKLRVETIEPAAFLTITCLASVGVTLSIAFLAFNLHFRKLKSIKLSSPRLSNMTAVGCILVYAAVILLGVDHATMPVVTPFSAVCTARVYLLSAGFSLAFGSMFTKTYRVHRIFTRSRGGVCKEKLLQDTQLISLICVLLLIDGLIVTLWVFLDPMERHLSNLTLEISSIDRSVVYQPQVEVCRSQHTNGWLGALYTYKGLLLIVGVYMAWETRHVKIPALNDSQYIGVSVYSVVITSGIVVVLANLMSERVTLAFVTITTLILISTTATLCLLFLPKLLAILGKSDNTDPVIHSMGLKIECNTRRFVMDDRRELQYRVEVQNRVYRREMAALDAEISKLERQLLESLPPSPCSSKTSLTNEKSDISPVDGSIRALDDFNHPRTPSIGGGLPLLLLSVLPPVIPRASWPSTEHGQFPMRRSVCFSSQPKLCDNARGSNQQEPAIDLLNLCLTHTSHDNRGGFMSRIRQLFGVSRPPSRKTSTASFTGNSGAGLAAALKVHMGLLAGLVPGARTQLASSCHTLDTRPIASSRDLRRQSLARSGPTINILPDPDTPDRKRSLVYTISKRDLESKEPEEPRVNFILPADRRKSITHQNSQPVISFRERAKGSPRFPHKIVPTSSLTALEDNRKGSSNILHPINNPNIIRRCSQFAEPNKNKTNQRLGTKWKSMEDATLTMPGVRRGSGVLAMSVIPSDVFHSRASSYSPNCDVWATAEFGIPLSELDNSQEKRLKKNTRVSDSVSS